MRIGNLAKHSLFIQPNIRDANNICHLCYIYEYFDTLTTESSDKLINVPNTKINICPC